MGEEELCGGERVGKGIGCEGESGRGRNMWKRVREGEICGEERVGEGRIVDEKERVVKEK